MSPEQREQIRQRQMRFHERHALACLDDYQSLRNNGDHVRATHLLAMAAQHATLYQFLKAMD